MKKTTKPEIKLSDNYREETPKLAITATVVAVVLVGAPLAFANKKIMDEGAHAANVSQYTQLARQLDSNVAAVRSILEKGVVEESVLVATGVDAAQGPTLITPPVTPTNMNEASQDTSGLNVRLSAIYWNVHRPVVTIDNTNYEVGEKVHGYTILEIRKTEVVFRSPAGEKIVKYFYDYLD